MRPEGHNGMKLQVITIDFDLFTIFESDRGGHEAWAFVKPSYVPAPRDLVGPG